MALSWLDRFIVSAFPSWGVSRLRARNIAEHLARHYEAASKGRRNSGWTKVTGDANSVQGIARRELRTQARDLIRNNGWARRAQKILANNVVGWGIVPKPVGDSEAANAAAAKLWAAWAGSTECDSEGRRNFAGLQALAVRTIFSDGEVLIRRRQRRTEDGLTVPLQLQLLESDYLDSGKTATVGQAGGPIIEGVEYDKLGRRAYYWMFDKHPGSSIETSATSRPIPASEILHVFYDDRLHQVRGISMLGAAIVDLQDLGDYEDAELMKQKIAACFAAFVTDAIGTAPAIAEQSEKDELVETFEPGLISRLPSGTDVKFATPPQMTSSDLPIRTLRKVAAGIGCTYEDLTGDYSQVNFSSARMGRIAHMGNVRDWQGNMVIPQMCSGVWAWFTAAAIDAGLIPATARPRADWTPPPLPMIEPDKEALGYSRQIRNGLMTLSEAVREQGGDPAAHMAALKADADKLDELQLVLDCDPRKVSQAGLTQVRVGVGGGSPGSSPASE
jgi:lambda family phage portal protein